MNYTVNQLAKLSGVTIRTLRFYDEIGLLKPAFVAENGYRYYQENELLLLQQILFFRELGFELKQIQSILKRSDFDKLAALQSHKKILEQKIKRLQTLMVTIGKTINHLQGNQTMNEHEFFDGLDNCSPEYQKFYREFLEKMDPERKAQHIQMHERERNRSEAERMQIAQEQERFWNALIAAFKSGLTFDHLAVQALVEYYFDFMVKYNRITLTRETAKHMPDALRRFPEHIKKVLERFPEFTSLHAAQIKRFDDNPGLADFMADAMKFYVEHRLS